MHAMNPARIIATAITPIFAALLFLGCGWTDDDPTGSSPVPPATPQGAINVGVGTDEDVYFPFERGMAVFENFGPATVVVRDCSPLVVERSLDGQWIEVGRPIACVPGLGLAFGSPVRQGEFVETNFIAPADSGVYRLQYPYIGCDLSPPGSLNCTAGGLVENSNEFEVVRELCDARERGCQIRPGVPTLLCQDGINITGPSRECTLDPSTLECGYEMLSCP
jgi:hypothetical protein